MRWRSGLLTASSALLLAGCGGADHAAPPRPPRIPASVAARLAAEAEHVAALAPGSCAARDAAARFRADVMASIGRVPARYREPLMRAANELAERLAGCAPPPAPPPVERSNEDHGKHGKHGNHGKHGKKHDDGQGNEGGNG